MAKTGKFPVLTAIVIVFGCIIAWTSSALAGDDCFTIVVGKKASADGNVIMAHNEDDSPPQVVHHRKMARQYYEPGEVVTLADGGQLEQVDHTWAYIWAEMPGMRFSDSYLNEWGVCVASDACQSREDNPELTDGGISLMLRRLIAQRAKSAREGVLLAGELVERFGYNSSGRTYTICDPEEGWLFCAVNGKHWLAKRVPDDEIAIIANTYTVHKIDLADTANYLASSDIIDYAISRGWYDPEEDGAFDFAAAYANPNRAADSANFCRQWGGLRFVAASPVSLGQNLPFSVKPKNKLGVANVMEIMRDHYEGTELYEADVETGNPHNTGMRSICAKTTQTSFVAQLRNRMTRDIGLVYWVCLGAPCTSFYIPYYFGAAEFPAGYASDEGQPSREYFNEMVGGPFDADGPQAFWTFANFHRKACNDYKNMMPPMAGEREAIEGRAMKLQGSIERTALELYPHDKDAALKVLADYSDGWYLLSREALGRFLFGQ